MGLVLDGLWQESFKEGNDDAWGNYTVALDEQRVGIAIMTNGGNREVIYKDLFGCPGNE
jgi:hypothetical protein